MTARSRMWVEVRVALLLATAGATSPYAADRLPSSTDVSWSPYGPPVFALTDQNGWPFHLTQERGRSVLLFFGCTTRPDVYPTTLATFHQVKQALARRRT